MSRGNERLKNLFEVEQFFSSEIARDDIEDKIHQELFDRKFPIHGKGRNLICPFCGGCVNCFRSDRDSDYESYQCYGCGAEGNNKKGMRRGKE